MKFLVVDDSATMRRIVINSLQRIGYHDTIEAEDGQDALAKFDSSVSMVITDWNMPNMTGTEFTKVLRSRDDGRHVPILMVTGDPVQARRCLDQVAAFEGPFLLNAFDEAIRIARGEDAAPHRGPGTPAVSAI